MTNVDVNQQMDQSKKTIFGKVPYSENEKATIKELLRQKLQFNEVSTRPGGGGI